ncbi:DUF742 domain-containing protein [Actinoallomurus iriomotensis]|uniref:DUF742 domain-containing protein n=1 Tax=Actinoallomurus iriomotensis TaxID=478107 RepID=A0A9W6RPZ1_9ACTN|nr:DUF742 domain-containing protein [Actinoallomurus iriomotensis]GLY79648.1 hypothetical protein Airi01_079150 [Actinoallomurus iriomotensis]
MSPRLNGEEPDRLYTVTGGRSRVDESPLDIVTLIVTESGPEPGMQSEHARILEICAGPLSVVEISAELGLPVTIVKILLIDLLDTGHVTARSPLPALRRSQLPDLEILKQVLIGLQKL